MCYNTQRKCLTTRWHISIFSITIRATTTKKTKQNKTVGPQTSTLPYNPPPHPSLQDEIDTATFRRATQQPGVKLGTKERLLAENAARVSKPIGKEAVIQIIFCDKRRL